jgi:hypothetical protein
MALWFHVNLKTHEKFPPAILTSILFEGLQQASSSLQLSRVFNHGGNLELLQLILKLWCCHHTSLSREFAKEKK